jgi:hypothetical protein
MGYNKVHKISIRHISPWAWESALKSGKDWNQSQRDGKVKLSALSSIHAYSSRGISVTKKREPSRIKMDTIKHQWIKRIDKKAGDNCTIGRVAPMNNNTIAQGNFPCTTWIVQQHLAWTSFPCPKKLCLYNMNSSVCNHLMGLKSIANVA